MNSPQYIYKLNVNGNTKMSFVSYYDIETERDEVFKTAAEIASRRLYRGMITVSRKVSFTPSYHAVNQF